MQALVTVGGVRGHSGAGPRGPTVRGGPHCQIPEFENKVMRVSYMALGLAGLHRRITTVPQRRELSGGW